MDICHEPDKSRFVIRLPGREAELVYADRGSGVLEFLHTSTPPSERGKGVAARLVAAAVGEVRQRGQRIIPRCWYVQKWLAAHPEEAREVLA